MTDDVTSLDDEDAWLEEPVTITKGELDTLLHMSRPYTRYRGRDTWWRWRAGCGELPDEERELGTVDETPCVQCEMFSRLEKLVPDWREDSI
jgi:hypothetical protein